MHLFPDHETLEHAHEALAVPDLLQFNDHLIKELDFTLLYLFHIFNGFAHEGCQQKRTQCVFTGQCHGKEQIEQIRSLSTFKNITGSLEYAGNSHFIKMILYHFCFFVGLYQHGNIRGLQWFKMSSSQWFKRFSSQWFKRFSSQWFKRFSSQWFKRFRTLLRVLFPGKPQFIFKAGIDKIENLPAQYLTHCLCTLIFTQGSIFTFQIENRKAGPLSGIPVKQCTFLVNYAAGVNPVIGNTGLHKRI